MGKQEASDKSQKGPRGRIGRFVIPAKWLQFSKNAFQSSEKGSLRLTLCPSLSSFFLPLALCFYFSLFLYPSFSRSYDRQLALNTWLGIIFLATVSFLSVFSLSFLVSHPISHFRIGRHFFSTLSTSFLFVSLFLSFLSF